jgi:hypothetical protein
VRVTRDATAGEVEFFLSDDGSTWTQLGSTVTSVTTDPLFNSTALVKVGSFGATNASSLAGKFYRAQVLNGIDGTKVLDVDTSVITSGAATTFTALTGQTVTINRSTAGRKAVAVVSPVWLFGTDDYMQVADNDLIDFGASDSFTVLAVVRQWTTPVANGRVLNKDDGTSGWRISNNTTSMSGRIDDGPNADADARTYTYGSLLVGAYVIDRGTGFAYMSLNGTAGAGDNIAAYGAVTNASPLYIGSAAGGAYQDLELIAVAVFRRALTSTEITALTTYFQGRVN